MRMAIAYDCLFPWTKGGGERLYRRYAEEWAAAGHDVTYITRRQWPPAEPPAIMGVTVVTVSADRELYDATGTRRLAPALRFAQGLLLHLARHRSSYDALLVSGTPSMNVLAARAALVGTGTRMCVDWLEAWRPQQWRQYSGPLIGRVASALQRLSVRLSPAASTISELMAERLREEGLTGSLVVAPGLLDDIEDHGAAPRRAYPPTVIYVGRHIADKRVEAIPAALAVARRSVPDLRAVILGDGPTRPLVVAEVARLGLHEVVELPGFVAQHELDKALRTSACLVLPSAREGYGLVVVEAAASGTPSVVVRGHDNAAVELIDEGVNGFVAASAQADDLASAVVKALDGGIALRTTTREWFEEAARARTMTRSAAAVRALLESMVQRA